jgi:hypothetical protein
MAGQFGVAEARESDATSGITQYALDMTGWFRAAEAEESDATSRPLGLGLQKLGSPTQLLG